MTPEAYLAAVKAAPPSVKADKTRTLKDDMAAIASKEADASATAQPEITAELKDGTIMGLSHKTLPIHGVQFHPESIRSEHGHQLLQNFVDMIPVPA